MSLDVHLEKILEGCIEDLYSANITHNLNRMADAAGIYHYVWRPEEVSVEKAEDLITPLTEAIALLRSDPERFKKFNPENEWGTYDGFVEWLEDYLAACQNNPSARVRVSR